MDWLGILSRIGGGEGEHTEFKRAFDKPTVGKAICAFANTEGGIVILGVTNARDIVGVNKDAEAIQERLTSFVNSGFNQPVSARLGRHEDPKGWVHWIEVDRQRGPDPMMYDGRVWVRRGRSSVAPSPAELRELYNVFGVAHTEELVVRDAAESDVDTQAFRGYLQGQGLDVETGPQPIRADDMRSRGVLADLDGELHPTLFGILAFGKYPQGYRQTRNFVVECVAYEGGDRSSKVLLVSRAAGRIDEQVRRSAGWLSDLRRFESYHGLIRNDRYLLPPVALRESLVNAVVHRDYAITGSQILLEVFEGRVEVTSPGGLPNRMSVESVRAGGRPRSRNESLAHCMMEMRFMEKRGRGWPTMRQAMLRFNGTEPDICVMDGASVRVVFHLKPPEGDSQDHTA